MMGDEEFIRSCCRTWSNGNHNENCVNAEKRNPMTDTNEKDELLQELDRLAKHQGQWDGKTSETIAGKALTAITELKARVVELEFAIVAYLANDGSNGVYSASKLSDTRKVLEGLLSLEGFNRDDIAKRIQARAVLSTQEDG